MYTEEVVLGWAITFLCIGFFMLGMASGFGKEDDGGDAQNWG